MTERRAEAKCPTQAKTGLEWATAEKQRVSELAKYRSLRYGGV
jgi:hypothetical protein